MAVPSPHIGHWKTWHEVEVRIFGIPSGSTTLDLWQLFHKEGTLDMIELYGNARYAYCMAKIRFSPAPEREFWIPVPGASPYQLPKRSGQLVSLRLDIEPPRRNFLISSPVRKGEFFPERITLYPASIEFGIMCQKSTMIPMKAVKPSENQKISLCLNIFRKKFLDIQLPLDTVDTTKKADARKVKSKPVYRFLINLTDLKTIQNIKHEKGDFSLIINLESPPRYFRRFNDIASSHNATSRHWSDWDAWYRQTDVVSDPSVLKNQAISLPKANAIIDLGRWTTYRFRLKKQDTNAKDISYFFAALKDFNIVVEESDNFVFQPSRELSAWDWIDDSTNSYSKSSSALLDMQSTPPLAFPVRYQLEVCISQGILNEQNIKREFVENLLKMDERKAIELLEHIESKGDRIYDPISIFNIKVTRGSHTKAKIPQYCVYSRKATVTPTTIYYHSPSVEISNRVIRHYAAQADRFLRVQFTDEKTEGDINGTDKPTSNEVFTRIKRTMVNGIKIGDRHFEFLAFGNSQFRERGAFFFSPTSTITAQSIRRWMGFFDDIKIVAKYAARLGQCFSTTRAITGTPITVLELADVERDGFCFTDGVGRMSPFVAQMIMLELNLQLDDPPSVVQFRLGGCKGVLAIHPDVPKHHIRIRKSQYKFAAQHLGLEIIRWSQYTAASLNRQLILVLSALGAEDKIFLEKQNRMLIRLELAMNDERTALDMLQKNVDPNGMTMTVASLVEDGFMDSREPFVLSTLKLWRAWSIKYLKEKAKIMIENGAFVLGCTDESGTLKGWFQSPGTKTESGRRGIPESDIGGTHMQQVSQLPEIFVQISDRERPGFYKIIQGLCLVARNPSLHSGDIRVVNAVDSPLLHHLRDVVVFPQTGDRDIPSMCSGGDLDGDDYIVMWDQDLMPKEWNHEPMDFTPPKPETVENVTVDDITSFFIRYMKNDKIGQIAHAHLAHADSQHMGVKSLKCLELAQLHSLAVDYAKTGYPATMSENHKVRKWPHFMEKRNKGLGQIYVSEKILGQLYDHVERVDFIPHYTTQFDDRILNAHKPDERLTESAGEIKRDYDSALKRIMAQHSIQTEFEVWSTFVLSHDARSRDYKFHEEIGQLSQGLKDTYRAACIKSAGGKEFHLLGPFVVAMYLVTKQEVGDAITQAQKTCRDENLFGNSTLKRMPLMTFPWIFPEIMSRIAKQRGGPLVVQNEKAGQITACQPPKAAVTSSKIEDTLQKPLDDIVTNTGVTRRGEILKLFTDSFGSTGTSSTKDTHTDTSEDPKRSPVAEQLSPSMEQLAAFSGHNGNTENQAPSSNDLLRDGKSNVHKQKVINEVIEDDIAGIHPAYAALDKLTLR